MRLAGDRLGRLRGRCGRGRHGLRCRLLRRLRSGLNANQRGGAEEGDRHEQNCQRCAHAIRGKGLAEKCVVQKAFNAMSETTGTSHGDSYEGWARRGREFEQDLCVGRTAGSLLETGTVADGLGQIRKLVLEPPTQRAEPEERRVEAGEELQVEVALANVGALVGEDDTEFLSVPGA